MALKPDVSLTVSLATGAVVWAIYNNALPTLPDIRVGKPNDPEIDGPRRAATYTAAGVVAAISLLAKDPTIFVIGGGMVIAGDWLIRHANNRNPMVGGMVGERVALQDVSADPAALSGMA
jgi:hypothetical protein